MGGGMGDAGDLGAMLGGMDPAVVQAVLAQMGAGGELPAGFAEAFGGAGGEAAAGEPGDDLIVDPFAPDGNARGKLRGKEYRCSDASSPGERILANMATSDRALAQKIERLKGALELDGSGPVLRLFHPCALIPHAQGSSGVVDNRPFAWRGHTKSLTTRVRPSPDLAVWLE